MNVYTVQQGDSLWKIIKNNCSDNLSDAQISQKVEEVSIFNNIDNPSNINIGQEIDLSCFDDIKQNEIDTVKEEEEPSQEQDKETASLNGPEIYEVKQGDSLWKITKNYFGETLSDSEISEKINKLSEYNNISNPSNINAGQKIDFSCFSDIKKSQIKETETENIKNEEENITENKNEDKKENKTLPNETIPDKSEKRKYNGEIQFHRGTPEDYEFETEEIKERATEMWNSTQNNAIQNDIHRSVATFDENGKVIANSEYYEAQTEGELTGYTIMVNAGHGGHNPEGGAFDPGAVNEEYKAEEWEINHEYAEDLTEALLAEGANVFMTSGHYQTLGDAVNNFAQAYGEGDNDNLKLVSLHCNASSDSSVSGTIYFNSDGNNNLTENLLEAGENIGLNTKGIQQYNTRICQSANENNIDNALIEMAFISNPNDVNMLLNDKNFKDDIINSIVDGIISDTQE